MGGAMKRKPFLRWRVDCGSLGVMETWARSSREAMSRIRWRLRNVGIFENTAYFGEPKAVDERVER